MLTTVLLREYSAPHPPRLMVDRCQQTENYFSEYQLTEYYFNCTLTTTKTWTSRSAWCCKANGQLWRVL
eukprot:1412663-Pleurochrysis_carterae.AAC.1